jgi:hypothetical protein
MRGLAATIVCGTVKTGEPVSGVILASPRFVKLVWELLGSFCAQACGRLHGFVLLVFEAGSLLERGADGKPWVIIVSKPFNSTHPTTTDI